LVHPAELFDQFYYIGYICLRFGVQGEKTMCMFCAAVPVTVAIGANLNNKQNAACRTAEKEGVIPHARKPIAKITLGVVIVLTVGSAIYHTILSRIWGLPFI
jgi:hypothetical protein